MVKFDDDAMTWYDHGKIMAWQLCFSNPGTYLFEDILEKNFQFAHVGLQILCLINCGGHL